MAGGQNLDLNFENKKKFQEIIKMQRKNRKII